MTVGVRTFIKRGLFAAGYYARELDKTTFPGAAILCYHGIRDDAEPDAVAFANLQVRVSNFEAHCRLIRETCDPVSLQEWRRIRAGGSRPPRPVIVTFDDGYRSVVTRALPILEALEMPAAVFVCTEPIAARTLLWFDRVAREGGENAVAAVKNLPYAEWRARTATRSRAADDDPQAVMSIADLQQLARSPRVEIGSHSASHPLLANATLGEQREELHTSKRTIEEWIGRSINTFAYPNGRPGLDYTADTVRLAADCGYADAFSIGDRFAETSSGPFEQPRFTILDAVGPSVLAHRLSHAWPR
jgi:peptidoglycan/xylan/chitin deacetylase (PgdA/CDA1 family)